MNLHISKELLGYLSILASLVATVPYCALVLRGKAKPHVFSWVIWGLVTGIAAAARSADAAGPGAWASWAGSASCFTVALFALFNGERHITRADFITFVAALAAIPVWRLTHDPLAAVIMVSAIDGLGYVPTMRKSWSRPRQEPVFNYLLSDTMQILSLFATVSYSLTTVLYPAFVLVANTTLIVLILWRRHVLEPQAQSEH